MVLDVNVDPNVNLEVHAKLEGRVRTKILLGNVQNCWSEMSKNIFDNSRAAGVSLDIRNVLR